jgi:hypothetical protein
MARRIGGSGGVHRSLVGVLVGVLAASAIAGCGEGIDIDRVGAKSTGTTQSMATSAAVVAAEETAFLSAVRPERELFARVAGLPTVDDSTLLAYGYGVCRHAARTGDTWPEIERNALGVLGVDPRSDGPRSRLLLIRAARTNICG